MGNINTTFFDNLDAAATWSAGVAFKRSKGLPLDKYSVFETKALAIEYAEKRGAYAETPVSYPGQVIAVAEGNKMVAYVLAENAEGTKLELQQIGIIPTGDDKTIDVTEDGQISLLVAADSDKVAGSQLTLQADGTIKWVKPDTTTAEGQAAAIKALEATVNGTTDEEGNPVTEGLVGQMETLLAGEGVEGSIVSIAGEYISGVYWGDTTTEDKTATIDDIAIKAFDNEAAIAILNGDQNTPGSVLHEIDNMVTNEMIFGDEGISLNDMANKLTGDATVEGSVDNKIKTALDETKFGTEDNPLGKPQLTLTEMADAINDVEIQINDYIYTTSDGETFDIYDLDTRIKANAKSIEDTNTRIDVLLDDEGLTDTIDSIKEIQEELDKLGEAVQLEEQFAKKADKVTGATAGNFAGLDANGNLTDSGKKAADFEVAGAAAAVLGTDDDDWDDVTVKGNRYKINDIQNNILSKQGTQLEKLIEAVGYPEADDTNLYDVQQGDADTLAAAKEYADGLADNYDEAGAAETVKTELIGTDDDNPSEVLTLKSLKKLIDNNANDIDDHRTSVREELGQKGEDGLEPTGIYGLIAEGDAANATAIQTLTNTHNTDKAALESAIALKADKATYEAKVAELEGKITTADGKGAQGIADAEAARQLAVAAQADADTNAINIQEIEKELNGYGEGEQKVDGLITKVSNNTSRIATLEGTVGEHTISIGNNATAAQNAQDKADSAYALAGTKADQTYVETEIAKLATKTELTEATNGINIEIGKTNAEVAKKADKSYIDEELAKKADKSTTYTITDIDNKVKAINDDIALKANANDVYTIGQVDDEITAINLVLDTKASQSYVETELGKRDTAITTALEDAKKYVDDKNLDQYTTEQEVKDIVDTVVAAAVEGDALEGLTDLVEYINTHGGEAAEMAKAIEALEAKPGLDKEGIVEAISGGVGIQATPIDNGKEYLIGISEAMAARIAKADTAIQPADIGTMAKETATDYVKKSEATGYTDILTKTEAATTYQPAGEYATAAQGAKADTAVQSVTSLHDAIVVENTNGAVTINFATEIILNGGGADV